jgi:hypothetical protein
MSREVQDLFNLESEPPTSMSWLRAREERRGEGTIGSALRCLICRGSASQSIYYWDIFPNSFLPFERTYATPFLSCIERNGFGFQRKIPRGFQDAEHFFGSVVAYGSAPHLQRGTIPFEEPPAMRGDGRFFLE